MNEATGLLTWNSPPELGTFRFVVSATDTKGSVALQAFTVLVIDPATNRPPEITSLAPPNRGRGGLAFLHDVDAIDIDDDWITYSLVSAPPGMTISGTGLIRGPTTEANINDPATPYTVRITDELDAFVERTYSLNVVDRIVNSAPIITSRPVANALADYLYAYDADASDADGDTLSWRLEAGPLGMIITYEALGRLARRAARACIRVFRL
jgi:hypothetical protein